MKLSTTFVAGLLVQAAAVLAKYNGVCYCMPGNSCWPTDSVWDQLNTTVNGRLIATVPLGSPCHDPNYNEAECTALQNSWIRPQTHLDSSSSLMEAFFANQSCDPFTPRSQPCELDNYVRYAVNVSSSDDVKATLSFVQEHNIRLVIRNTGHDFLGRSTGAGSLAIWTHHLRSIDIVDWSDSSYSGRAMKMGAGVLGYEALEASAKEGVVIVSGECPTVGVAGGFTQGGGHSALSTTFGLGADQTLEFEVVTAAGEVLTASRTQNSDLYWALSGGGGGTYAVVLSVTVRAHPDAKTGGASLQMAAAYTTPDNFYQAVSEFHTLLPAMIDSGAMVVFYFSSDIFIINPITAYNQTKAQVEAILAPFIKVLDGLGIPYQAAYSEFDSYRDHYANYLGPLPYGGVDVASYQFGGRLIPREVVVNNNEALQEVLRNITENGVLAVSSTLDVSHSATNGSNAVHPAWRKALITMQLTTPWNNTAEWSTMVDAQHRMTNEFVPLVESVTPGSGTYMNEADFRQPNFQETFFGPNYDRLLAIKRKYDPKLLFYTTKGVGSEFWTVADNGQMCRV